MVGPLVFINVQLWRKPWWIAVIVFSAEAFSFIHELLQLCRLIPPKTQVYIMCVCANEPWRLVQTYSSCANTPANAIRTKCCFILPTDERFHEKKCTRMIAHPKQSEYLTRYTCTHTWDRERNYYKLMFFRYCSIPAKRRSSAFHFTWSQPFIVHLKMVYNKISCDATSLVLLMNPFLHIVCLIT